MESAPSFSRGFAVIYDTSQAEISINGQSERYFNRKVAVKSSRGWCEAFQYAQ